MDAATLGNGFNPLAYGPAGYKGAGIAFSFTAPPYNVDNFPADITGPVTITLGTSYVTHVPDTGSTLVLLALSLLGIMGFFKRLASDLL